MKCSICKIAGHKANNKQFHPIEIVEIEEIKEIEIGLSNEFDICENLYNKNTDLNTLYNNPNGIKYLMIRSFAKDHLCEIYKTT